MANVIRAALALGWWALMMTAWSGNLDTGLNQVRGLLGSGEAGGEGGRGTEQPGHWAWTGLGALLASWCGGEARPGPGEVGVQVEWGRLSGPRDRPAPWAAGGWLV